MEKETETFDYLRQKFVLEKENGKIVTATVQIIPGVPATKISPSLAEYFKTLYDRDRFNFLV